MSKYIIELDENAKEVVVISLEDGDMWTGPMEVEDLEQLNSDYINDHFGGLQEDAYQRGLEHGKAVNDKGCEGCKYANVAGTHEPCVRCSNSYGNQWTAKDDKIEVGDEVNWLGDCFIVTRIYQPRNMKEQCDGIDDDGCVCHGVLIKDLEKTGRHFDIGKILEEMRK